MKKSFIVTGASASGKSTLINEAKSHGYIYLPTHMTRKPRENEENYVDAVFLTDSQFVANFEENQYIEPSLDFALLKKIGVYYGTPVSWIESLDNDNYCASPVSIQIASMIAKKTDVLWIHLFCSNEDRYKRLEQRGISKKEIESRMNSGDSINIPNEANLIINTSKFSSERILRIIQVT